MDLLRTLSSPCRLGELEVEVTRFVGPMHRRVLVCVAEGDAVAIDRAVIVEAALRELGFDTHRAFAPPKRGLHCLVYDCHAAIVLVSKASLESQGFLELAEVVNARCGFSPTGTFAVDVILEEAITPDMLRPHLNALADRATQAVAFDGFSRLARSSRQRTPMEVLMEWLQHELSDVP